MSAAVRSVGRIVRLGSAGQTPSKYRNKPTIVEGLRFDSKKEAERWRQLQLLERAGHIRNIQRQTTYKLEVAGKLICKYKPDFEYDELAKGERRSPKQRKDKSTNFSHG